MSKDGQVETRNVKIGKSNALWVEVIDGVQEGEIVLLSPPDGFEPEVDGSSSQRDFFGGERSGPPSGGKKRPDSDGGEGKSPSKKGGGRPSTGPGKPDGSGSANAESVPAASPVATDSQAVARQ